MIALLKYSEIVCQSRRYTSWLPEHIRGCSQHEYVYQKHTGNQAVNHLNAKILQLADRWCFCFLHECTISDHCDDGCVCQMFANRCLSAVVSHWAPDILVLRHCAVVEATAHVSDAGDVLVMFGVSSGD